ncbi:hypothetical protein [Defluviitalea phaphyphila]|uniref:hypothetical protein n=1 Tax=Defluviitalea phaphyphila TaxID=1473580 RepID=UPI0007300C76|nr:hypothetical protein [Defluviitalea phaphyphila]
MTFKIIPLQGTDKIKFNLTRQDVKDLFSKQYIKSFKKNKKIATDKFSFGNIFYDEYGKIEAIEFYEPSHIIFKNYQLINQDYKIVEKLFIQLDPDLIYEKGIGFTSVKY